jgi:hypothetical protein
VDYSKLQSWDFNDWGYYFFCIYDCALYIFFNHLRKLCLSWCYLSLLEIGNYLMSFFDFSIGRKLERNAKADKLFLQSKRFIFFLWYYWIFPQLWKFVPFFFNNLLKSKNSSVCLSVETISKVIISKLILLLNCELK